MKDEKTALAATLTRLSAAGVDVDGCALLRDLLGREGLKAQWDSFEDRPLDGTSLIALAMAVHTLPKFAGYEHKHA